jgi:hypothetical protein
VTVGDPSLRCVPSDATRQARGASVGLLGWPVGPGASARIAGRRRQRVGAARWAGAVTVSAAFGHAWQPPRTHGPTGRGAAARPRAVPAARGRSGRQVGVRLGGALCAAAILLAVAAAPADAHLVGTNAAPTNYRTRILGVSPPIGGLIVQVAEIGGALALINRTGQQVMVLGSRLEPYLRIGSGGGVDENRRSPTWLASRLPASPRPRSASRVDPAAPPDWHRISGGVRVVWHDHRSHWTGPDPPQVRRAPDRAQVVIPRWQVPLRVGGRTAVTTGEVVWIPGPSPWPWVALAGALAAGTAAVRRTQRWRAVLAAAVLVGVASDMVHTVGAQLAAVAPILARAYASGLSAAGWALGVVVAYRLLGGHHGDADLYFLLVAGLFFAFAGGLADVTALGRSQVSTALPVGLARATTTMSLGLGVGIVIVALRRPFVDAFDHTT